MIPAVEIQIRVVKSHARRAQAEVRAGSRQRRAWAEELVKEVHALDRLMEDYPLPTSGGNLDVSSVQQGEEEP